MGAQWHGMGSSLMRLHSFRDSILRSDEAVKPLGLQVSELLLSTDETCFDDLVHSFVSLTAIQVRPWAPGASGQDGAGGRAGVTPHAPLPHQIALIDLLTSMGLRPDGIIGHSLGEVACGYADGCLSQEEAVLTAYWRGQCIKEADIPPGAMAAVGGCPLCSPSRSPHQPQGRPWPSSCSHGADAATHPSTLRPTVNARPSSPQAGLKPRGDKSAPRPRKKPGSF